MNFPKLAGNSGRCQRRMASAQSRPRAADAACVADGHHYRRNNPSTPDFSARLPHRNRVENTPLVADTSPPD